MLKCCKCGFTLIELLVVIVVVGLLVAVIVPVLGRAKDKANVLVCQSNQKNLLIKCLVYAHENNASLPVDVRLHNSHTVLLQKLSDDNEASVSKAYYCPSERSDELKYSKDNFANGDISYFYYCFTDRPNNPMLSAFYLKSLPWPRLLKDTDTGCKWVFSDSWFSGLTTAHRWYKKGVNYITLDGSIHFLKESPREAFK